MAKESMKARDRKRTLIAGRHSVRRAELKAAVVDPEASREDRKNAMFRLDNMPRDGSASRQRRRCSLCGRPRGLFRKFGLCRICLRWAAMRGYVPGLTKSSW